MPKNKRWKIVSSYPGLSMTFDSSNRWKRATRLLTERQDSVLRELKDTHLIEVRSLDGVEADQVWENATEAEPPDDFGKSPLARITDLASGLLSSRQGGRG